MSRRDLVKEYLAHLEVERGLSVNSRESYRVDLAQLGNWAGAQQKFIEQLERADISAWLRDFTRNGLSASSVARKLSAASGFYRFLQRDGHLKINPTENVTPPRREEKLPRFLTEDEVERFLDAPDTTRAEGVRDRAVLEILYATGVRVSELASLEVGSIDLDQGLLRCRGKGNKERLVPIGKSARSTGRTRIKRTRRAANINRFSRRIAARPSRAIGFGDWLKIARVAPDCKTFRRIPCVTPSPRISSTVVPI